MKRWWMLTIMLLVLIPAVFAMGRKAARETRTVHAYDSVMVREGITGRVEIWEGNFMPMMAPGKAGGKIIPGAGLRVRIHEPVRMSDGLATAQHDTVRSKLVVEAVCDSSGHFRVAVRPGTYSVFVEHNGGWYANSWDGAGVQGAATVEPGKLSEILIKITDKATF
jgi:hypothetical protein